jgi:hypothetical protein
MREAINDNCVCSNLVLGVVIVVDDVAVGAGGELGDSGYVVDGIVVGVVLVVAGYGFDVVVGGAAFGGGCIDDVDITDGAGVGWCC